MIRQKALVVLLGALLLAIIPGLVPAEEKSVNMLQTGPLTGPASPIILPLMMGLKDCLQEINDQGGVDGVKINFLTGDDRYSPSRALSFYQRYRRLPKLICMGVWGTPQSNALYTIVNRDKLPIFVPGGGRYQHKPGYVFLISPPYQDQFGAVLDWAVADWKKKGRSGMPTVGLLGWQAACKDLLNGGAQYAKKIGVRFLQPEFCPPGAFKFDVWLLRLAEGGANYVYIFTADPATVFIRRDAYNLGLTKKIQFIAGGGTGLINTRDLRLVKPEMVEGAVVQNGYLLGDEVLKHPLVRLFTKYRKKPVSEMEPSYIWGVATGKIVESALRIALKEVGYEKINGEAFYKALQKVQGDVTKGIFGTVNYSPKSRRMNKLRFYRIINYKHVPISGWLDTPDTISLGEFK